MTDLPAPLIDRMIALARNAASRTYFPGLAAEAVSICALLPEPVDPDLIEARKLAYDGAMIWAGTDPGRQSTSQQILDGARDEEIQSGVSLALEGIKRGRELASVPTNDWIPWEGVKCSEPVKASTLVEVQRRDGTRPPQRAALSFNWRHAGGPHDIIAYRSVTPR